MIYYCTTTHAHYKTTAHLTCQWIYPNLGLVLQVQYADDPRPVNMCKGAGTPDLPVHRQVQHPMDK